MLTRSRLDALFALRAAAKMADREVEDDFIRRFGYSPFDREAVEVAGRHWTIDRWSELREAQPAVIAYEEADRTLSMEERTALVGMIELEWEYDDAPRLDLLLDLLESRQRHGTH